MAFDIGWDCRESAGYITDPSYGVPCLAETYPHTYTNTDGYSTNAGWDTAPGPQNLAAGNDPRIAGSNYKANDGNPIIFTVDLASGSAPGAGDYMVDLAVGDATAERRAGFKVLDNGTTKLDGTNGGSGYTTAAGHFIDATLADVAASTTWTGTPVSIIFGTTTAQFGMGYISGGNYSLLAHFRLTLEEAPPPMDLLAQSIF
jgi:hypothetical protein